MPSSNRKLFSQYYTKENIADLMVSQLPCSKVITSCIDLGAGEGALISAIKKVQYPKHSVAVDIDPQNISILEKSLLVEKAYCNDSNDFSTIKKIIAENDKFDLVIGNPPYGQTLLTEKLIDTYRLFGLTPPTKSKYIRSELVFILHGLFLLKKGGYLIYVVPDGIMTNEKLKPLRKLLHCKYCIEKIIEIPSKSFSCTEAKTHIIVIKNINIAKKFIDIYSLNAPQKVQINAENFYTRADHSFYIKPTSISKTNLKNIDVQITRGRLFRKQLEKLGVEYIHSTNIYDCNNVKNSVSSKMYLTSKKGDIILARVGSRSIGKVVYITKGGKAISDCMILIRCDCNVLRNNIFNSLTSDFGQLWLQSVSKGVGARHISITELYNFPLVLK